LFSTAKAQGKPNFPNPTNPIAGVIDSMGQMTYLILLN